MGSEITAGEAASIFEKIAQSLGMPSIVVEIGFIILTMIIILIVLVFLFTILRIRKEMISLNFKLGYIARLLKREIEGPATTPGPAISPEPSKSPEPETREKPAKEEPYKEEWKF